MKKSANLLSQKPFEENPLALKFFYWVIGVGRVIIIFTNAIVLLVFLSRFKLDSQVADLSEEIEVKRAILQSTGDFEAKAADFQQRLKYISQALAGESYCSLAIKRIEEKIPPEIALLSLEVSGKKLYFKASSPSPLGFGRFISSLILMDQVKEVTLSSASFDKQKDVFIFSLEVFVDRSIFQS